MIVDDPKTGGFRFVQNETIGGKRVRRTKRLPAAWTREQAERFAARYVDDDFSMKERIGQIKELPRAPGSIYILKNSMLPGLLKIGMTVSSIQSRIKNLSSGFPVNFELVHDVAVHHALELEQMLHQHFREFRVAKNKEFFRVDEVAVIRAMNLCEDLDGNSLADAIAGIGRRKPVELSA